MSDTPREPMAELAARLERYDAPAPVSSERVEGRGICSECGEPTDGTDHNAACMMERVADLLDEYRSSGDGSTRTGDFIWADRLLLLVRTPSGAAPRSVGQENK